MFFHISKWGIFSDHTSNQIDLTTAATFRSHLSKPRFQIRWSFWGLPQNLEPKTTANTVSDTKIWEYWCTIPPKIIDIGIPHIVWVTYWCVQYSKKWEQPDKRLQRRIRKKNKIGTRDHNESRCVELVCLLRLSMIFLFSWCFVFHFSMNCNSSEMGSKPAAFTLFAVVEPAPPQPVANGFCRSECLGHAKPMRSSLWDTVRRKMQQMYTTVRCFSHSSHTKRRSLSDNIYIYRHRNYIMHIYIYLFTILPRNLCIYRVMLFCMIIDVLFLSTSLSVYSCWIPPDGVAPCQCEVRTDLPSKIYFGENFISSLPWSLFSKRKTGNVAGAVEKFHEMDAQNRYFIGHIASSASNCTEVPTEIHVWWSWFRYTQNRGH